MSVYAITNNKNGLKYIGSTNDIKKRRACHKSSCFNQRNLLMYNIKLYRELRKITNKDNFYDDINFDILESGISKDNLKKRENFYIKKYDTIKNGLNTQQSFLSPEDRKITRKLNYKKHFLRKKEYYKKYMKSAKYKEQKREYYKNLPKKISCDFCKYKCKRKSDLKCHKKKIHNITLKQLQFLLLFSSVVVSLYESD
jgi:hypothetical protein